MCKLIGVVNDRLLVFDKGIEITYKKLDEKTIIGENIELGVYICYEFSQATNGYKAFGGSEFDIKLDTGEVVHCDGNWWSVLSKTARNYINADIVEFSYNTIDNLVDTYVFYGGAFILKENMEKLLKTYDGKNYKYREYEDEVIKPIRLSIKEEFLSGMYDKIISNGFQSLGKWTFKHPSGLYIKRVDTNYYIDSENKHDGNNFATIDTHDLDLVIDIFDVKESGVIPCKTLRDYVYLNNKYGVNFFMYRKDGK